VFKRGTATAGRIEIVRARRLPLALAPGRTVE
jgi:hypothetical protein